jgi:outer membrane murein-binding lipoprotein Lpp
MNFTNTLRTHGLRFALVILGVALLAGCARKAEQDNAFSTPDEAVTAFVTALEKYDMPQLKALLGPASEALLQSSDPVQDKGDREQFLSAYKAKHSLADDGADRRILVVGNEDWPMPIPIVKRDGKWAFDGEAGIDELIYRRVGANELGAIDVCRGYVAAQVEYASEGRDGDSPGIYALKLLSDEGLHNGLYWPAAEGEPPSPAGPFVAAAASEGYRRASEGERHPYHGYYYRPLFAQGANANGGAREYFKDGLLTEGFALIAWPADYGASGVMTFIVNQDGVVFQKDLGEDTATAVQAIQAFDPDSSWVAIAPPEEAPAG